MLRVQFKDALRSPYSGCFKIDDYGRAGNWFHYNSYPSNNASATIGYCTKEQRWLIFDSLKYDSESDPCSATEIARSSMTSAFDVGSTFEESWFSDLNTPVEMFFFQATNEEEFHCDSFINDGICNPSFNDLYNQFDGGDCCAATCKGPHCGIHDGDVSARKYLHCKDQQSTEPITFLEYLDATELMSRENLFQHNTSTESLEVIELSKSNFFGTIPSEIGLMTNLRELDLSTNRLSGTVPTEIGLLTKVTSLRLDRNQLSGPIPSEIGLLTKLTHLGLFDNQFDSTFPTEITLLTNLSSLELCDNHFNSTVPSEIKYLTNLKSLHLCIHQLHGTIPGEILSLKLTSLILNGNHFRSTIPTEIGLLSNLGELSINGFRGNIPSEIIHLKELTSLVLNDNQFESSIPKEIGLLTKLTQLGLSHNQLTGTIPNEIRWLTNMEVMDLKMNKLTGTILSEIGFLTNLIYLDLSYNQLDGSVPIESGKLKRLESFLINDNRLVGTLPAEVYWMDLYELNWRNNPELDVPPYYLWE
jgi:Leucine-rich repeat (LRR) protein